MKFQNKLKTLGIMSALVALPGCVTQAGLSFESTLTPERAAEIVRTKEIDARFAEDFDSEVKSMFESGHTLIGYSKFVGPLPPHAAKLNARMTGRKQGATMALLAPPEPANMNQHRYVFTYWRPSEHQEHLFGAFYSDAPAHLIALATCGRNLVSIDAVAVGSPAALMGLKAGDTILRVNDRPIVNAGQLDAFLIDYQNKDVSLWIMRGEKTFEVVGRLGEAPKGADELKPPTSEVGLIAVSAKLSNDVRKIAKRKNGLFVEGIAYGTYACSTELAAGDLLLTVDGKNIRQPKQLVKALESLQKDAIDITYLRGGDRRETTLRLDESVAIKVTAAQRRRILESDIAQPPWSLQEGTDFTWLTFTALIVEGAGQGYINHLEAERQRIEAYNRAQAMQPKSNVTVVSSGRRGGGYEAITSSGESYRINAETAAMLKANPGFSVYGTDRRNTGFEIVDRYGSTIQTPGSMRFTRPMIAPGAASFTFDFDAYARKQVQGAEFQQAVSAHMKQASELPGMFQTW